MRYGLPYKGSKNKIAERIVDFLPKAKNFYDLFAGGCAITHCAMLSGKYENFIINDIEGDVTTLFVNAIHGKYRNERRWISRDTFELLKGTDPYIRYVWSFGNSGRGYMYSREIEPYKETLHSLIFEDDRRKRYLAWKKLNRALRGKETPRIDLERLQSLQRLQSLNMSYDEVEIREDSVIYCDIPYKGTNKYQKGGFDHEKFYEWARHQENIFISEYDMPDDFVPVLEIPKRSTLSATSNSTATIEKLYVPKERMKNDQLSGLYKQNGFCARQEPYNCGNDNRSHRSTV